MPQFKPLKFFQFNWNDSRIQPEKVISPPYDVLSLNDRQKLTGQAYNVVHLDSPSSYEDAADRMQNWIRDRILVQDRIDRYYIMATDYRAGNDMKTRWGVFGGLKLHPFGEKKVFPHEQTYARAKKDRLDLMQATHAQLSPIFGIYDDPELILEKAGSDCLETRPSVSFIQEPGVSVRIWPAPDAHNKALENLIHDRKVFIADGHHRYETALDYQKMMPGDENAPWNYVFVYLSNISSPGLEIFPYHRLISPAKTFDWESIIKNAANDFHITSSESSFQENESIPSNSFYMYFNKTCLHFTPRAKSQDIFFKISAYVLDKLFLRQAMGLSDQELASGEFLSYTHDQHVVTDRVDKGTAQAGFILRPVPMDVLQEVCETGKVMPRKSTFFYPKLPTGVLFHIWKEIIA